MSAERFLEPWRSFLVGLEAGLDVPVTLICLGGFAVTLHYGLDRPTGDIDVCEIHPHEAAPQVLRLGGLNSDLHRVYGIYLQLATVSQLPDNYESRVSAVFSRTLERLRLFVLDPYDLALSKIQRNSDRDIEDVKHLARVVPFDLSILATRCQEELRPYLGRPEREDLTLSLWIEAIQEERARPPQGPAPP